MPVSNQEWWLIVEDHEDEFVLMRRACARALNPCPVLEWQIDGVAAVEYLAHRQRAPQLIISDLKMPRMNGLEFLAWACQYPPLNLTPFVILSNSGQAEDKRRALTLGADGYWVKPTRVEDFKVIFQEMAAVARAGKKH
jgi:two-component system, chemotaxis family, response regulator Rcp1